MPDPRGNWASLISDITGYNSTALNLLSDFIGSAADASGAYAMYQLLAGWLGGGQPDQIQMALANIQTLIIGLAAGEDMLMRNMAINAAVDPARKAMWKMVGAFNDPSLYLPSTIIDDCFTALAYFSGPDRDTIWNTTYDPTLQNYWTDAGKYFSKCEPWVGTSMSKGTGYATIAFQKEGAISGRDEGYSSDVGYGPKPPPANPDGHTVSDYRYSLAQFLYAVSAWLAAEVSFDPNYATNVAGPLRFNATFLNTIHDNIFKKGLIPLAPPDWSLAGLVATACPFKAGRFPVPTAGIALNWVALGLPLKEVAPDGEVRYYQPVRVASASIEYGAVETFSGYSSVGTGYQIDLTLPNADRDPAPFKKLQLRLLKRTKDVYVGVGLRDAWPVINQLKALVGDAPLPGPNFGDWSFREVRRICGLAAFNLRVRDVSRRGILKELVTFAYSVRALAAFIIQTQPFDTPYTNAPPGTTISFRQLLTNFPN